MKIVNIIRSTVAYLATLTRFLLSVLYARKRNRKFIAFHCNLIKNLMDTLARVFEELEVRKFHYRLVDN